VLLQQQEEKETCHPARETKALGNPLFQLEFQAQSIECTSLYVYISQQTQVDCASYADKNHGKNILVEFINETIAIPFIGNT